MTLNKYQYKISKTGGVYKLSTSGAYYKITTGTVNTANDVGAVHLSVASEISGITEKTEPHNDDLFLIEDSEDTFNKKKLKASRIVDGGSFT